MIISKGPENPRKNWKIAFLSTWCLFILENPKKLFLNETISIWTSVQWLVMIWQPCDFFPPHLFREQEKVQASFCLRNRKIVQIETNVAERLFFLGSLQNVFGCLWSIFQTSKTKTISFTWLVFTWSSAELSWLLSFRMSFFYNFCCELSLCLNKGFIK